ncbi:MAG: RNA methyltransferase [Enhygromyxa sp.]
MSSRSEFEALAAHYGAGAMIEALRPYLTEQRRERIEAVLRGRLRGLEVAIERPYDPHNAAAVVRSAEALGAWAVHVIEASERILRAPGTTTGTHVWIDTRHHRSLEGFLQGQREAGMLLAGACVDATHMLDELPLDRPICLLFGNEHAGLSAAAQAACEVRFRIPIYGFAESYNLSVAAALSLYATSSRVRARLGAEGDLDEAGRELERARCYFRSVDERHARALFPRPPDLRG